MPGMEGETVAFFTKVLPDEPEVKKEIPVQKELVKEEKQEEAPEKAPEKFQKQKGKK